MILKNKKGVSPVIAVVLMIAVAVAIAVIVYAWASGFAGKATGAGTNVWSFVIETKAIDDSVAGSPACFRLYIRNTGDAQDINADTDFTVWVGASDITTSNFAGVALTDCTFATSGAYLDEAGSGTFTPVTDSTNDTWLKGDLLLLIVNVDGTNLQIGDNIKIVHIGSSTQIIVTVASSK